MDPYNKTTWVNGSLPAINAENLNHIEDGIADVTDFASELDDRKADASSVYTKAEVDTAVSAKADASNVYTKAETDARIAEAAPSDIGGYVEDYLDEHSELFTGYTKAEADSTFKTKVQADIDHSVLNTRIGNINRNISTINDNIDNRYTKSETDALVAAAIQTAIGGVENGSY
ncbi:MAG: hypothetical protein UIH27_14275 [Ruminococcus sp.]|nr:hypothetical protein [Ruminococcus sp.]